ncbi:MAG TPA: endonuclease NucS domain-containing protein [Terracidiphilus sp.]|jgi:hypothetical protein|nr:endonuclease NucS domain-containing protein [Terracidiphilus sp.]
MKPEYRRWLEEQKYDPGTVSAQIYRTARVEEHYGNLDGQYDKDRLGSVLQALRYTTDDQKRGRPNPSKIPFEGNIRNNLASYRNAVERYRRFRELEAEHTGASEPVVNAAAAFRKTEEDLGQRIGLERDLQAALRKRIDQLEPGLTITDDGAERSVSSGFIDITAKDSSGATVVIELKAGVAGQRAIAQILSYMGDISAEDEDGPVKGILVASEFDSKAKSAAKVVPTLTLRRYSVYFQFCDG